MRIESMCSSISKLGIQSLLPLQSKNVGCLSENFQTLRNSCGSNAEFKLLGLNGFGSTRRAVHKTWILQPITRTGEKTRDTEISKPSNRSNKFFDGTVGGSTLSSSVSSCFSSIQYCDAQRKTLESQESKHIVRVFVLDIETTGFCRENARIIEIAMRDLLGGENSCFQTLVNPDQNVPNSHIHGITTNMVHQPGVPRMKDLIPILLQYIKSRQIPGEIALFVAHNGRCFDVPFLSKEFSRCSMEIPSNWLFFDTLPLARELMKLNGSKLSSLQALSKHYEIPSMGSSHRAMSDVNLLTSVLERMTFDMKLTVSDFLERSFKA